MIGTAITYAIVNKAIDIISTTIQTNFATFKFGYNFNDMLEAGSRYDMITVKSGYIEFTYYNCEVTTYDDVTLYIICDSEYSVYDARNDVHAIAPCDQMQMIYIPDIIGMENVLGK